MHEFLLLHPVIRYIEKDLILTVTLYAEDPDIAERQRQIHHCQIWQVNLCEKLRRPTPMSNVPCFCTILYHDLQAFKAHKTRGGMDERQIADFACESGRGSRRMVV